MLHAARATRSAALLAAAAVVLLCVALVAPRGTHALIHHLSVEEDGRNGFFIENFGFNRNGVLELTVRDFKLGPAEYDGTAAGFFIRESELDASTFLEQQDDSTCVLYEETIVDNERVWVVELNKTTNGAQNIATTRFRLDVAVPGFYNTFFINCQHDMPVSFDLELLQYNINADGSRNYLSAGDAPLPSVYFSFGLLYLVLVFVWIFVYLNGVGVGEVNRVHHLMSALLVVKMLTVLAQGMMLHYISLTGSAEGWNIIYYVFASLKGVMLFVMIALIGTGWAFIKPFLTSQDKKLFLVVIPLQVLDNVALIIFEEATPGSQSSFTWYTFFRVVDIICCCAILIPVIWSIKHLREAVDVDGKAMRSMKKLKLFRHFYLTVVCWIYFTRIIVYLMDSTLPYQYVWLGDFFTECAALAFFTTTGYTFRPGKDNPYFSLNREEREVDELIQEFSGEPAEEMQERRS